MVDRGCVERRSIRSFDDEIEFLRFNRIHLHPLRLPQRPSHPAHHPNALTIHRVTLQ